MPLAQHTHNIPLPILLLYNLSKTVTLVAATGIIVHVCMLIARSHYIMIPIILCIYYEQIQTASDYEGRKPIGRKQLAGTYKCIIFNVLHPLV